MGCLPSLYPLLVDCLGAELVPDLRIYVQLCFRKVGQHALGLDISSNSPQVPAAANPASPSPPTPPTPPPQEEASVEKPAGLDN